MSRWAPSPHILRRISGPVRWSPWGSLNSAEWSPLSTGLQNHACQFPSTRLLSDIALGMRTRFRGSVPMSLIMADEVEEFQVVQPVILAIAVFVMDFCRIIHGEEALAVRTSYTLMLKEFSSGCVQSDVRAFSCAPVAPVAIIWACFHTERDVTCDGRLIVPFPGVGFPHHPV